MRHRQFRSKFLKQTDAAKHLRTQFDRQASQELNCFFKKPDLIFAYNISILVFYVKACLAAWKMVSCKACLASVNLRLTYRAINYSCPRLSSSRSLGWVLWWVLRRSAISLRPLGYAPTSVAFHIVAESVEVFVTDGC